MGLFDRGQEREPDGVNYAKSSFPAVRELLIALNRSSACFYGVFVENTWATMTSDEGYQRLVALVRSQQEAERYVETHLPADERWGDFHIGEVSVREEHDELLAYRGGRQVQGPAALHALEMLETLLMGN
jgi:hypothetical protein